MDVFSGVFKFFITFFIFRTILSLFLRTKVTRKRPMDRDISSTTNFEEEDIIDKMVVDMVLDEICESYIDKNKAYQIVEDDKTHYFCSWDCRAEYIDLN